MGQTAENTKVTMGQNSSAIQDKMAEMKTQKEQKSADNTQAQETAPDKGTEASMGGANRQSSDDTPTNIAPRALPKRKLAADASSSNDQWYLEHDTEELAGVTGEISNLDIGLKKIRVSNPTAKQWEKGTVANITIDTIVGTIGGIQVRESQWGNGQGLYMQTSSRSWEKNGEKQYQNDVELSRKMEAQILSFVDALLVPAEEQK